MDHHPYGTHKVRVILAAWPTECIQNCQPRYVNANSNNNIDNNINNNSGYTVWSGHFSDTDTHSHTHIEHWHIVRPCRKKMCCACGALYTWNCIRSRHVFPILCIWKTCSGKLLFDAQLSGSDAGGVRANGWYMGYELVADAIADRRPLSAMMIMIYVWCVHVREATNLSVCFCVQSCVRVRWTWWFSILEANRLIRHIRQMGQYSCQWHEPRTNVGEIDIFKVRYGQGWSVCGPRSEFVT